MEKAIEKFPLYVKEKGAITYVVSGLISVPRKLEAENLTPARRGLRPGGNNLYGYSVEMG